MIYYGYNGESTNVKTGLQYLRARYYDAENGTFTTEDDNLGTTEKPLTRNRYDYTTNNPVNYRDPTGHSLWKRIKRTVKKVVRKVARKVKAVKRKIANTVRRVAKRASTTTRRAVKRVVHTAKKTARTVSRTVRNTAKAVKNVATHPKQTYHAVRRSVAKGYQKVVSKGSRLVRSVSNGVEKVGKTYTSFKSYVAEKTSKIRSEVVRQMCTTTNRITNQLGKVNWKNVAIGGASYSAVSSGLSGNNLNQVAQDTLSGGLTGAVTGGVLGGLTYGAGKAIGVVKNLVKGSSSSATSGHITEMATKNLSDIGNKSESQLDIGNGDPYELLKKHGIEPTLSEEERAAADAYGLVAKENIDKSKMYEVGEYKKIKGGTGLDAHHVGQKAVMKNLVSDYDFNTAPAINVPKKGHTILGDNGIVSRKTKGFDSPRQVLARDLFELKRVYSDIPKSKYEELIKLNMEKYPEIRK